MAPSMHARERALVPAGMTAILPRTARRVRRLEETLVTALSRWGYQEIIPPTFEYLDVLSAGLEPELVEQCYKFADRTTGRILLLRPDVTAQIARIVAMGMVGTGVPLRLCYRTTVFRYEPEHAGREREIFQIGAELIGVDDVMADAEIVALMGDCLRQLGFTSFKISLGHVLFFKSLLARSGLSPGARKRAEHAAARKDLPHLEEILAQERVPRRTARAVLEVPGLYGQEEVLERGRALAGRDALLRETLDRLARVYRLLAETGLRDHLLLDLGELRGFDYYDGVVFDVFAEGLGCELGGGGRYNHLIGRFGRELPSTGFAFDVDRLFRTLDGAENGLPSSHADVLLVAPPQRLPQLFRVAGDLRQAGWRVVQRQQPVRGDGMRRAIEEGRREGVSAVVMVGVPRVSDDEVLLLTGLASRGRGVAKQPGRRRVKIKELPALRLSD